MGGYFGSQGARGNENCSLTPSRMDPRRIGAYYLCVSFSFFSPSGLFPFFTLGIPQSYSN